MNVTCQDQIVLSEDVEIYISCIIVLSIFIIIMNSLVIITFVRFEGLRQNNNNLLVLSLSVADFYVGLAGNCLSIFFLSTKKKSISVLQDTGYIFIPLSTGTFISCLTLILMTLDRLLAVTKPLHYHRIMPKNLFLSLLSLTWFVPCLLAIINIILKYIKPSKTNVFSFACIISFYWTGTILLSISNIVLFRVSTRAASQVKPNIHRQSLPNLPNNNNFGPVEPSKRVRKTASILLTLPDEASIANAFCIHNTPLPNERNLAPRTRYSETNSPTLIREVGNFGPDPISVPSVRKAHNIPENKPLHARMPSTSTLTPDDMNFRSDCTSLSSISNLQDPPVPKRRPSRLSSVGVHFIQMKNNLQTSYICILVTAAYLGCVLPVSIHVFGLLMTYSCPSAMTYQMFASLILLNSFINPLLYFLKRKVFRKSFKKLICENICSCKSCFRCCFIK